MKNLFNFKRFTKFGMGLLWVMAVNLPVAAADKPAKTVHLDNYNLATSDLYFAKYVKRGALGKFVHNREPAPIDHQNVIRMNRDTLYSFAIVDLDAGPATVVMPNPDGRFMSIQVIDEEQYSPEVIYKPGSYTFTRKDIGTRYVLFMARTFMNPNSQADLKKVHALQDKLQIKQASKGAFEIPNWDTASQKRLTDALNDLSLANGGVNTAKMFGPRGQVDELMHLLGSAGGWAGNPRKDAIYLTVVPAKNDGKTPYRLDVKDVPVDGFWSISLYNKAGYYQKNPYNAYSLNNITATPNKDGSFTVWFGQCDQHQTNCLPTMPGWNLIVRLYRPHESILNGSWKFPKPVPVK